MHELFPCKTQRKRFLFFILKRTILFFTVLFIILHSLYHVRLILFYPQFWNTYNFNLLKVGLVSWKYSKNSDFIILSCCLLSCSLDGCIEKHSAADANSIVFVMFNKLTVGCQVFWIGWFVSMQFIVWISDVQKRTRELKSTFKNTWKIYWIVKLCCFWSS